jgi:predicted RNA-binding Zn ribbon-like protein
MPLTREGRGTGAALAVDLVNTFDEFPRPEDLIEGPEDVRYLLEWHGLSTAARTVDDGDVERLRGLRARFAAVFDAAGEDEAAALLNDLVREYGTPPQLERADGGWRVRAWPDEGEGLSAAAAFAAVGLLEALRDLGFGRFGRCAGSPCRCAYVDRSRNKSRLYCCEACSNRVAQASSRRRRRAAPRRAGETLP